MAQTKKKRRRKHRGTQAGMVDRRGSTGAGRPGQKSAAERRAERLDRPPTWRGALNRAAVAALIFGVLVIVAFGRPVAAGVSLAAVMLLVYIPMSYYTDRFIYNRRQRRKATGK